MQPEKAWDGPSEPIALSLLRVPGVIARRQRGHVPPVPEPDDSGQPAARFCESASSM